MSHDFIELGLLERENAAILNASLQSLASELLPTFDTAFGGLSLTSRHMLLEANAATLVASSEPLTNSCTSNAVIIASKLLPKLLSCLVRSRNVCFYTP